MFEDKLIVDMYYSENHVEVNLDAFLASEEYAKESIKDLELDLEQVFDQNAAGSTKKRAACQLFFVWERGELNGEASEAKRKLRWSF